MTTCSSFTQCGWNSAPGKADSQTCLSASAKKKKKTILQGPNHTGRSQHRRRTGLFRLLQERRPKKEEERPMSFFEAFLGGIIMNSELVKKTTKKGTESNQSNSPRGLLQSTVNLIGKDAWCLIFGFR